MQSKYKCGEEHTSPKHTALNLCMLDVIFNAQRMV